MDKKRHCKQCYLVILSRDFCKVCRVSSKKSRKDQEWVECTVCNYWIHVKCDPAIDSPTLMSILSSEVSQYYCIFCRRQNLVEMQTQLIEVIETQDKNEFFRYPVDVGRVKGY